MMGRGKNEVTFRLVDTMIRVLVTACLVGSVLSKTCESLPNLSTNQTLDGKDRISSFFSPGHCLAVDAKMNAADLHGPESAKLYWADCKNIADDSKTPLTLTNKRGKSVQVVVAEFQHFAIKRKNRLQNDFSLIKLKDGYKADRCITVSGFSEISSGVRLQLSRCDKKNPKMRFTGNAAGLWLYKNKKRSKWCLWPPMKTGDTAKVGACISGLLGGRKSPAKINGNWATWTKSGSCSKACGSGRQNFTRTCSHPAPAHGGNACPGSPSKFEACNPQPCAVNGNWTVWSKSGSCSQACGAGGKQNYTKTCTAPKPAHGGKNCTGSPDKSEPCNTSIECPVDGSWTVWSKRGSCSKACGDGGKQNYTRTCTAPKPAHGGKNCTGSPEKSEPCNTSIECPVNGNWTTWSNSTSCSVTCGNGTQTFIRSCTNPTPAHGGSNCTGLATRAEACNTQACGCRACGCRNGYKCYDDIDNGGWRLVRRTGSTSHQWHLSRDNLKGDDVYGDFSDNPLANNDFSRQFVDETYNQFLFMTGDKTRWMIVDRSEVESSRRDFRTEKLNSMYVVKSSRMSRRHKTCWVVGSNAYYPRITITVEQSPNSCRNGAEMNNFIMYKGNGFKGYMNPNTFKGLNVFIRMV